MTNMDWILFIPKERENNDKTLRKNDKMVIATKYEFGIQLCDGNVLASLTPVVLNGNLQIARVKCFFMGMLAIVYYIY